MHNGEIGRQIKIMCKCKENLYEKEKEIYIERKSEKQIGFKFKNPWLIWKSYNFDNVLSS